MASAVMFGPVDIPSVDAAPPPPVQSTQSQRYWWRSMTVHTGQESFFIAWMDAEFGPDWLDWMPDELIAQFWAHFRQGNWAA